MRRTWRIAPECVTERQYRASVQVTSSIYEVADDFCGSVWIYTPPPLTNTRSADRMLAKITSPHRDYKGLYISFSTINITFFHSFSTGNKISRFYVFLTIYFISLNTLHSISEDPTECPHSVFSINL